MSGGPVQDDGWVDEGDWEDATAASTPDMRSTIKLPEHWLCHIHWEPQGKFKVSYKSDDGVVLRNHRELRQYLEGRPDLDSKALLSTAKFTQHFAKRVVLLHHRTAASTTAQQAGEPEDQQQKMLSDILRQKGELNFEAVEGGVVLQPKDEQGQSSSGTKDAALTQMDLDERMARRLQEEENRRAGFGWLDAGAVEWEDSYEEEEEEEDDDSDDDDDSQDMLGDVAAGGWRMRESQQQEEVANDEDVSCLEVKKVEAGVTGHCPVCQEVWKEGDQQRVLPCGHGFHPDCVDRWLKSHKAQCPLCKKDIREDWEDEDEEVWDPIAGKWVREEDSGEDQEDAEEDERGAPGGD